MQEEELRNIADGIVLDLANRNMTFRETVKTLQLADTAVRKARSAMYKKVDRASIKEALKETGSYSSSFGNSAKV